MSEILDASDVELTDDEADQLREAFLAAIEGRTGGIVIIPYPKNCFQHENGTWIHVRHGRPHTCPKYLRIR